MWFDLGSDASLVVEVVTVRVVTKVGYFVYDMMYWVPIYVHDVHKYQVIEDRILVCL
jgi:hypothetical protein